jgi:hypothetical protein
MLVGPEAVTVPGVLGTGAGVDTEERCDGHESDENQEEQEEDHGNKSAIAGMRPTVAELTLLVGFLPRILGRWQTPAAR